LRGGWQSVSGEGSPRKSDRTVEAVLFDLDGTLTKPILDWPTIKRAMGCPEDVTILEWFGTLAPERRAEAERILLQFEMDAAARCEPAEGAAEIIEWLRGRGIKTGIVTRNCRRAVRLTLERLSIRVDAVWTRDDGPVKPDPEPILSVCRRLGVNPEATIMVGDYRYDLDAAKAAGARAVLLVHGEAPAEWLSLADEAITDLRQIRELL